MKSSKVFSKKIICCTYELSALDEEKPFNEKPLELFLDHHYKTLSSEQRMNDNIKLNIVQKISDYADPAIEQSQVESNARVITMTLLRSEESKPYTGKLDEDDLTPINGHVFEQSTWLVLPHQKLLMYVYDHYAPKQKHLQDYLNKFLASSNHFITIQRKLSKKTMEEIEKNSSFSEIQLLIDSGGKNPIFMDRNDISPSAFATQIKLGVEGITKNIPNIEINQTLLKFKLNTKDKDGNIDTKQSILDLINYVDIESDNVAAFKVKPKGKDYIDLKYSDKVYFRISLKETGYEYITKQLIIKYIELKKEKLI